MPGGFGEIGSRGREMTEEILTLPQGSATVAQGGQREADEMRLCRHK